MKIEERERKMSRRMILEYNVLVVIVIKFDDDFKSLIFDHAIGMRCAIIFFYEN